MDKHLNCFYSYNRDNELIENNLTRALIVTLMNISKSTKIYMLSALLKTEDTGSIEYSFADACFALQNNISPNTINQIKSKYILTIADDTFIQNKAEYLSFRNKVKETLESREPSKENEAMFSELCSGSIPDAWIYDKNGDYCFLIECKSQGDRLYYEQIIRHANKHFGITDLDALENITINLTWNNILEAIDKLRVEDDNLFKTDRFLLINLVEYLSFFGVFLFKGVDLEEVPLLNMGKIISTSETFELFDFARLKLPTDQFALDIN